MKIVYSNGCTTESLTIDGIESADIAESDLAENIVALLQFGYVPNKATIQSFLMEIAEEYGVLTDHGTCEQCGDSYYTYTLKAQGI